MRHRTRMALALAGLAATTLAATASGGPVASKQRVAIEARLHLASGKGTWTLIPLSPGFLKRDSGTLVGGGTFKPPRIKPDGQKVIVILGKDSLTGRNGTFEVTQRVESVTVPGFETARGTWSFKGRTGVYASVGGGGGFAAVGPVNAGVLYAREEGYITKR
jgi:hypothetical protein